MGGEGLPPTRQDKQLQDLCRGHWNLWSPWAQGRGTLALPGEEMEPFQPPQPLSPQRSGIRGPGAATGVPLPASPPELAGALAFPAFGGSDEIPAITGPFSLGPPFIRFLKLADLNIYKYQ